MMIYFVVESDITDSSF